jgi:hypothetical protein
MIWLPLITYEYLDVQSFFVVAGVVEVKTEVKAALIGPALRPTVAACACGHAFVAGTKAGRGSGQRRASGGAIWLMICERISRRDFCTPRKHARQAQPKARRAGLMLHLRPRYVSKARFL